MRFLHAPDRLEVKISNLDKEMDLNSKTFLNWGKCNYYLRFQLFLINFVLYKLTMQLGQADLLFLLLLKHIERQTLETTFIPKIIQ